jgi:hypothetical protein
MLLANGGGIQRFVDDLSSLGAGDGAQCPTWDTGTTGAAISTHIFRLRLG